MYHRMFPLLVAALLAQPLAAHAAANVEDVLVTGSYSPAENVTSAVSVLDRGQILALNKRSVAGLLKTLPGVLVEEQGGPGGLTAVSIRGGESNFTVVMLDGVPVNDPTNFRGGGFDFANLNSALIERIEVVRGAQSAIYGSDALAGVINIITRTPEIGHHQNVYAQWGEDDFSNLGFSAQGQVEDFSYTLELGSRDDGEPVSGSSRDSDSANLRLRWQPAAGHSVDVGYRFLDGQRSSYPEQSGGVQFALSDDLDSSDYQQEILSLGWAMDISSAWRSTLRANRFEVEESYSSPGIPPYFEIPPNASETDFTRDQLQWINTLQIGEQVTLNLGADYRDENGRSIGYLEFFGQRTPTDFQLDRSTTGVFANISAQPRAQWLLQASARYDEPEDYDGETSLQLGAKYAVSAELSLSANWGEAYKLPSFFALGHALVGNPDLVPEQAQSWDVGADWVISETLRVAATGFFNDYRDLVDFDDATFRNVNRSHVETSGIELQADWQILPALSVAAQATYTDLDVKNEDTVLTGRPDWTAGLTTLWQLNDQWNTALDYRYTGQQWAASRHTGEEVTSKLNDYHRLDWVLRWQAAVQWQLLLSVDNLLDESYETAVGFTAPERSARIGVRFSH